VAAAPSLPRYLRRRAGSHNPYTHARRTNAKRARLLAADAQAPAWVAVRCRAVRRRPALLLAAALAGRVRALPTHAWHARRFRMGTPPGGGGPAVALQLHGRGRGTRALLRAARLRCVAHDASAARPLQLWGTEAALRSVLDALVVPPCAALANAAVRAGARAAAVELRAPGGAALAPATLQWRPRAPLAPRGDAAASVSAPQMHPPAALWLWLPPGAADDVASAAAPVCAAAGVSLALRGDLCRFEVVGALATAVLQRALVPIGLVDDAAWPDAADAAPRGGVTAAACVDPRLAAVLRRRQAGPSRAWPADAAHADCLPLWRCGGERDAAQQPAPEAAVCSALSRRRRTRLERSDGDPTADAAAIASMPPMAAMLVRRGAPPGRPELCGWSVVALSSWAPPLWRALARCGASPAGRAEWGALAAEAGAARFPEHYPDSPAGARALQERVAERAARDAARPPAKRPPPAPAMPWASSADGVTVARTLKAAASATHAAPPAPPGARARPVADAIRAGRLRWAERSDDGDAAVPAASEDDAAPPFATLLRVRVTLPGRGVAGAGAQLFALRRDEGEVAWRAARGAAQPGTSSNGEERPLLGAVVTLAPAGARRSSGAGALCCARALWAARCAQAARSGRDGGPLRCLLRNAGGGPPRAALTWLAVEDAADGRDSCWDVPP
jgi:ribonuclease P/MRP protein subunit POP1